MTAAQPYVGKDVAQEMLDHFFFEQGPGRVDIIPKRINPQFADEYIREKVSKDSEPIVCRHARQLVDFYDLRQTLPHFREFLSKQEDDAEAFNRSMQVVMMLAEAGEDDDWKLADDYFQNQLLRLRPAREHLPILIRCWASLGPKSSGEEFERQFADEVALREKTRDRGDEAEINYQELQAAYVNDLPRARRAVEFRGKVAQMKGEARFKALIENYARLDDLPPEYLNDWAARLLRRAADDDEAKARIIHLMRERVKSAQADTSLDQQTKLFVKRRLLRAVEYFDGTQLEEDERTFLEQQLKVSGEGDLLSTIQPEPMPG